ncbi:hypothetical protein [Nesterenkonia pannonica]|uniref:hypothetical protein n=1 Tax=Nesterenkonia pannonica TaxID=1548602 RepID=UPI00216441BC|nr:hypothetical protein [Nesterenkonia pannonica]
MILVTEVDGTKLRNPQLASLQGLYWETLDGDDFHQVNTRYSYLDSEEITGWEPAKVVIDE